MKPDPDPDARPPRHAGWGWLLLAVANLGAALFIGLMAWTLGQAAAPFEAVPVRPRLAASAPEARPAPQPAEALAVAPRAQPTGERSPDWARPAELSPHHFGVPGR